MRSRRDICSSFGKRLPRITRIDTDFLPAANERLPRRLGSTEFLFLINTDLFSFGKMLPRIAQIDTDFLPAANERLPRRHGIKELKGLY